MHDAVDYNYTKYWLQKGAPYGMIGAFPKKATPQAADQRLSDVVTVCRSIEADANEAIDDLLRVNRTGDRWAALARTGLLAPLLDWAPLFDAHFRSAALIGGSAAVLAGIASISYVTIAGGRVTSSKLDPISLVVQAHAEQVQKAKKLADGEERYAGAKIKEMRLNDLAIDLQNSVDRALSGLRPPNVVHRLVVIALIAGTVWFARNVISGGSESATYGAAANARSFLESFASIPEAMVAVALVGVESIGAIVRNLVIRGWLGAFRRRVTKIAANLR